METLLQSIPSWLLVLLGLVVAGFAIAALIAFLFFLFKLGVILSEARKPPHVDAGDYRLAQGHEVTSSQPSAISHQPPVVNSQSSAGSKRDIADG